MARYASMSPCLREHSVIAVPSAQASCGNRTRSGVVEKALVTGSPDNALLTLRQHVDNCVCCGRSGHQI